MTTSKLPSLIGMRSILKGWFNKIRVQLWITVASSGWPFVFAVPGQMTHLVASLTLDSVRSCVMQGAFLTHKKASSIPTVFSWDGSISPEGFLPSILLLLVIIVAVVIVVTVILVVVVVGEGYVMDSPPLFELGSLCRVTFHSRLLGNPVKTSTSFSEFGTIVGHKTANSWNLLMTQLLLLEYQSKTNFTLQSLVQLLRENTDSVRSNQQMRLTTPSVPLKLKG
ncbi:hypothetical protein Tco_0199867 [Tanacetum coccineum]